jgi:glycerol dehydrogenase-like iron-containing ADH family enzyme
MNYQPIDKESARELRILSGRWVLRRTARQVAVELKALGFNSANEFVKTCDENEIYRLADLLIYRHYS